MTTKIYPLLMLLLASCWLTACDNKTPNTPATQVVKKYAKATTLEGRVSNDHGLIKTGQVIAIDTEQHAIISTQIQDNGHYQLEIPADTVLPIVLSANQANAEPLIVAIIDATISKYDINPRTTAIANKAKAMGGYTRSNLVIAAEGMVSVPDANKTTTGFRGDPTTQYGGWH
jgi:hypothetical protein